MYMCQEHRMALMQRPSVMLLVLLSEALAIIVFVIWEDFYPRKLPNPNRIKCYKMLVASDYITKCTLKWPPTNRARASTQAGLASRGKKRKSVRVMNRLFWVSSTVFFFNSRIKHQYVTPPWRCDSMALCHAVSLVYIITLCDDLHLRGSLKTIWSSNPSVTN